MSIYPIRVLAASRGDAASYYRLEAPLRVLSRTSADVEITIKPLGFSDPENFDVLWLQGHTGGEVETVVRDFKEAGKFVIYDVDDWYFDLPPSWPGFNDYFNPGHGPKATLVYHERLLKLADMITTPSARIRQNLLDVMPEKDIRLLPNCVIQGDWDTVLPVKIENAKGPIIGWFGTGTHWDDWFQITKEIESVVFDLNATLVILGAPELSSCMSKELISKTHFEPITSISDFPKMRSIIKSFDIGIAWANSVTESSRCRSPLKVIQYGAAGVPFVASSEVYGDLNNVKRFGYIAYNISFLMLEIHNALYDHGVEAKAKAQKWQEEVWKSYTYETQAKLWLNCVKSLTW